MQPDKRNGILAILALVAVFGVLACRHGIRLPQESESALTAEIRTALDGDTEAATKFASLFAGVPHILNSPKLKTAGDLKAAMIAAREHLGQEHVEALRPITTRELARLENDDAPLNAALKSEVTSECKRLAAAYRAAATSKAPVSISDVLRKFADRMEARK